MARAILSEHKAKTLLCGTHYTGWVVDSGASLPKTGAHKKFIVKVDHGVKKRFKQGLVALDVNKKETEAWITKIARKGYTRFLVEPHFAHDDKEEQFISFERMRDGWQVIFSTDGGVAVEDGAKVETHHVGREQFDKDCAKIERACALPKNFVKNMLSIADKEHMAFVEINPLVIKDGVAIFLDCAVRVDDTATHFGGCSWGPDDLVTPPGAHPAETRIAALDETTPASLKLSVLNPKGSIFFLLSSGGASIVNADDAFRNGCAGALANYGEYSGAPTREETYLYAKEVLAMLLTSPAKKKALVIAGGVANFTDVLKTFSGIIDALSENLTELKKQKIHIFVRRGGPNEKDGLDAMRTFLSGNGLSGNVYGSDTVLTQAIADARAYTESKKQ